MTNQTTRSREATDASLAEVDPQIAELIVQEARRQANWASRTFACIRPLELSTSGRRPAPLLSSPLRLGLASRSVALLS